MFYDVATTRRSLRRRRVLRKPKQLRRVDVWGRLLRRDLDRLLRRDQRDGEAADEQAEDNLSGDCDHLVLLHLLEK